MADPTLKRTSVSIKYTASDGFHAVTEFSSGDRHSKTPPEASILEGIRELSRLATLFGFEARARDEFEGAVTSVNEWRQAQGGGK